MGKDRTADSELLSVQLGNGRTLEDELRHLQMFARVLDSRFSLLGLVPVAGDVATGLAGTYALYTAARLKLHPIALAHIGWNLLFDTTLGAIPVFGDAFDFFFKSNTKNVRVIEKHLRRKVQKQLKNQPLA